MLRHRGAIIRDLSKQSKHVGVLYFFVNIFYEVRNLVTRYKQNN
jgi:hypothetical protein